MIRSDWHLHSEASYDATLPLEEIAKKAEEFGFEAIGITDHANFNDAQFLQDLRKSSEIVTEFQKKHPNVILGVELTPIEKPEFDYIQKNGTREGYVAPVQSNPFAIELAQTKEELMALGVRYAIGASHWRVDVPNGRALEPDRKASIREWYRQQLYLACDERVTILGHPWYHGKGIWYEDFNLIDRSMNREIAAALKEHGKFAECNSHFFRSPYAGEKFRNQYAEFLREWFEMGVPITYGSDSHKVYYDTHPQVEEYLSRAGFCKEDLSTLTEKDFWF